MSDELVVKTLKPMMADRRIARIEAVLSRRTYGLTLVLEDLYDDGNISAILRTCDAFGVQRIHLIRTTGSFKSDRKITQGAHKWLDVSVYDRPEDCVEHLREEGYRIVASRFDDAVELQELDFSQRMALVFGNERYGVSDELAALCDGAFVIPMYGFAQSFNVSVAAAISVHHATVERQRHGLGGDLTEQEMVRLRSRYYRRSVKSSDLLLREQGLEGHQS